MTLVTAPFRRRGAARFAAVLALAGAPAQALAAPPEITIEVEDDEDPSPPPRGPTTSSPALDPGSSTSPANPRGDGAPEASAPLTSYEAGVTDPPASASAGPAPTGSDEERERSSGAGAAPAPSTSATDASPSGDPRDAATELAELRARVERLEAAARAGQRETRGRAVDFVRIRRAALDDERDPNDVGFGPTAGVSEWGLRLSGYVQAQYERSQLSEDQIGQGGEVLNRNRFVVRRGRLRLNGDWKWAAADFELDGSTTRGPFVGVRQANVSFVWRHEDPKRLPRLMVTAGLTEIPFGYEMRLGQREMRFMERSTGSLAFFPGPVDVGVRVRGALAAFRYDLAIMNGAPLDDRAGARITTDPTRKPDVSGRLGFAAGRKAVRVGGGASFLTGTGFLAGNPATKGRVEWVDFNENGTLDTGELVAVPGTAATPSFTFQHWAAGADLELAIRSKAGWTQWVAEGVIASNLDRDFLVSDPVTLGADLRQVQAHTWILQELFEWALVGARYDFYDPNSDLLEGRRGEFVPKSVAIHTLSPLVGATLPARVAPGFRGRLVVQYDLVWDALGRDPRGVPANVANDRLTIRLQGEF